MVFAFIAIALLICAIIFIHKEKKHFTGLSFASFCSGILFMALFMGDVL